MEGAQDTGGPSYSADEDCCDIGVNIPYALVFYFVFLLFVFTVSYTSYICNHSTRTQYSPPTTAGDGNDDYHIIRLRQGLGDDVLSTFQTFLYSEVVTTHKGDNGSDTSTGDEINYGSGCAICLVDYKPPDLLRLLPECSHLFHSSCIDTWLKVHPTCPVCRNSFEFSNQRRI